MQRAQPHRRRGNRRGIPLDWKRMQTRGRHLTRESQDCALTNSDSGGKKGGRGKIRGGKPRKRPTKKKRKRKKWEACPTSRPHPRLPPGQVGGGAVGKSNHFSFGKGGP